MCDAPTQLQSVAQVSWCIYYFNIVYKCVCVSVFFFWGGGGDAFSGISFCKIYVAIHVDHR